MSEGNEGGLLGGAVGSETAQTGNPVDSGNTAAPPAGDAGTTSAENALANNTVSIPENWKEAIPEDLRGDPSLKPINNFEGLIKSYVHAQKQMGMDKITIPSEHATDEEWDQLYHKLGLPENVEKYDVKPAEGQKADDDFFSKFKEQALAARIMPAQAQKLHDWFNQYAAEQNEQARIENLAYLDKQVGQLKQEWGDAFATNVQRANAVLEEYGGKELVAHLKEVGLDNDIGLVKMFNKVGEQLVKEGKFIDGAGDHTGVTVSDSESKIKEVMGDSNHPYHQKKHPGHKDAVQEMNMHFKNIRNAKTPPNQAVG